MKSLSDMKFWGKSKDPMSELVDDVYVPEDLAEVEEADNKSVDEDAADVLEDDSDDDGADEVVASATARPRYGVTGTRGPAPRFTWREVSCHDGTSIPKAKRKNAVRVANTLNRLRRDVAAHYGVSTDHVYIKVNSWYRTKAYNASIGGVGNSRHIVGDATDVNFYVRRRNGSLGRVPIARVAQLANRRPRFANGGMGVYSAFIHLDTRGYKARWVGP